MKVLGLRRRKKKKKKKVKQSNLKTLELI